MCQYQWHLLFPFFVELKTMDYEHCTCVQTSLEQLEKLDCSVSLIKKLLDGSMTRVECQILKRVKSRKMHDYGNKIIKFFPIHVAAGKCYLMPSLPLMHGQKYWVQTCHTGQSSSCLWSSSRCDIDQHCLYPLHIEWLYPWRNSRRVLSLFIHNDNQTICKADVCDRSRVVTGHLNHSLMMYCFHKLDATQRKHGLQLIGLPFLEYEAPTRLDWPPLLKVIFLIDQQKLT